MSFWLLFAPCNYFLAPDPPTRGGQNNLFKYTYNNDFYTIEIDHGRYDVDQFRNFINQAFSDNGHNIDCPYDKNTLKLSFKLAFPMYIINSKAYPTTCSALIGVNKNGVSNQVFLMLIII